MSEQDDNLTLPFQLEAASLRGRLVRLGAILDTILHQHAYPENVAHLLAEAIVIATALAASLKYDGVFTLQSKGDGAVRLLVVDVTSDGGIRAYAQFDPEKILNAMPDTSMLGKGYLAFTCALAGQTDRYQGIVELTGGTLAEAVQHYFRQSEQIPTGILAAARLDETGHWRGGCLLVQRMPRDGGITVEIATPESEDWTRAMMLMQTCTPQELTAPDLSPETLLYRLFHQESVRVYPPHPLRHQCRCSQERVTAMLRSLPRPEVEALAVEGRITVTCEFCNRSYPFEATEIETLWASN